MPYKINPFTNKLDYYETGTAPNSETLAIPSKTVDTDITGSSYLIAFTLATKVESIDMRKRSGWPSVKIGTSAGGNDILQNTAFDNQDINFPVGLSYPAGVTYYWTITGGNIDIETTYRNIFNL
jgi:hypothetical protein